MPTHDLVADFGAVADRQRMTFSASIGAGSAVLTPTGTSPFASGDVGKAIFLNATGFQFPSSGDSALVTILSFNAGAVTLSRANSGAAQVNVSMDVLWGTDNSVALAAFAAWAQAQIGAIVLTIPSGGYCWQSLPSARPNVNLKQISWIGKGSASTIISQLVPGQMYFGGNDPIAHKGLTNGGNSARLNSTIKGATSVTLKDPINYGSKITVGNHCLITGYDTQGIWNSAFGYPPNPQFYESNHIESFNSSTGVISLKNPLKYAYLDTWPSWNSGSNGEADPGGPATIYVCDTSYDTAITLQGITIDNPYNQSVAHGRDVVLIDVKNIGNGLYPTQNTTFKAKSSEYTQSLEVDKINGIVEFIDCALNILLFQSASPDICLVTGGSLRQLTGTPKKMILTNVAFPNPGSGNGGRIQVGCGFGRSDQSTFINCSGISTISDGVPTFGGIHDGGATATITMTNGVMIIPNTSNDGIGFENPTRFFAPGTWITFDDRLILQILSTWQDATNTYVQTSLSGGWPFTVTNIHVHPSPSFVMRGCTGTAAQLADLNSAPPGNPIFSYSLRRMIGGPTGAANPDGTTFPLLWGKLKTVKANVSVAYTGTLSILLTQFSNGQYETLSDYALHSDFGGTINMHLTGIRTIVGGSSPTGVQSGDSLPDFTAAGNVWLYTQFNSGPLFSANVVNGETPTVDLEYVTDQNITQPSRRAYQCSFQ